MKYLPDIIAMLLIVITIIYFAGTPDLSDSVRAYIDAKTEQLKQETTDAGN